MDETKRTAVTATGAAETPDGLLEGVHISKSFKNNKPPLKDLDRLSISLNRSETLAVVGASGIGKSTLLHILGTLDRPDGGALLFNGEDVFRYDDGRLARFRNQTMGFVFQFHHLLPEFTAMENAMMPAMIQGMDRSGARRAALVILERVGLMDKLHQKATELSGGEQQRVALARALALKPSILFADEPTGNLDKNNSEQIHKLLLELNRELGMAMVVVTHNMALASYMERQATIVNGKLEYL
jgi:lipoprotein-releasing system ATP-binding protein